MFSGILADSLLCLSTVGIGGVQILMTCKFMQGLVIGQSPSKKKRDVISAVMLIVRLIMVGQGLMHAFTFVRVHSKWAAERVSPLLIHVDQWAFKSA